MHYTSVPNILKVLNPLFLDDLRAKLVEAGDNARMLLNSQFFLRSGWPQAHPWACAIHRCSRLN